MSFSIVCILRILFLIVVLLVMIGCSQRRFNYQKWDVDRNDQLERLEFVNGYDRASCFRKWARGKYSIAITTFIQNLFTSADRNADKKLDTTEFEMITDYFHFGFANSSFILWDNNADGSLNKKEFAEQAEKTIGKKWDISADKQLSLYEMAGGVFFTYDKNNNGTMDSSEFAYWTKMKLPRELR